MVTSVHGSRGAAAGSNGWHICSGWGVGAGGSKTAGRADRAHLHGVTVEGADVIVLGQADPYTIDPVPPGHPALT